MICLLIFTSGNSVLHGLIPGSNKFNSKFLQNICCPLSVVASTIKGKISSSSGLSSPGVCVELIFSFDDC